MTKKKYFIFKNVESPRVEWPVSEGWLQGAPILWLQNKAKHQFHHHIDSWYEGFVMIWSVWFSPNVVLDIMAKHLDFGVICPTCFSKIIAEVIPP